MGLYRRKPVEDVREANRWDGPWVKLPGVFEEVVMGSPTTAAGAQVRHYVVTIQGQRAYLSPGDWVVAERADPTRHYPVQDAEFRAHFDPA